MPQRFTARVALQILQEKLRDLLIEIALPFDQLIDEFGCDWLHVSYREGRNRKERITAYRKNHRTLYVQGFKDSTK